MEVVVSEDRALGCADGTRRAHRSQAARLQPTNREIRTCLENCKELVRRGRREGFVDPVRYKGRRGTKTACTWDCSLRSILGLAAKLRRNNLPGRACSVPAPSRKVALRDEAVAAQDSRDSPPPPTRPPAAAGIRAPADTADPGQPAPALAHGGKTASGVMKAALPQGLGAAALFPEPRPREVTFEDPRGGGAGATVGVVGFHFPGGLAACDKLCGAPFLGNSWDLGAGRLRVAAAGSGEGRFRNAESAFAALQFWEHAPQYSDLSGKTACQLRRHVEGDPTYGGHGNSWRGMFAVLRAKFSQSKECYDGLMKTGDAYLLGHGNSMDADKLWYNASNGDGKNWLGLQLMFLREELRGDDPATWTRYATDDCGIDLQTGEPHPGGKADAWQSTVRSATRALAQRLGDSAAAGAAPGGADTPRGVPFSLHAGSAGTTQVQATVPKAANSTDLSRDLAELTAILVRANIIAGSPAGVPA